jgi:P pilus assembly chaperone PapD
MSLHYQWRSSTLRKCISIPALALLMLLALSLSAAAAPKLFIKDTRMVFSGVIYQGIEVKGEFKIQNRGDSDLVIKKVSPG